MRDLVWPRCASALLRPPAVLWERPTPRACDYSRLSGVIPLRTSRSAACQPPNLLCEAFAGETWIVRVERPSRRRSSFA
jgi:hypothetical protein